MNKFGQRSLRYLIDDLREAARDATDYHETALRQTLEDAADSLEAADHELALRAGR
jgi:hypothetical protein